MNTGSAAWQWRMSTRTPTHVAAHMYTHRSSHRYEQNVYTHGAACLIQSPNASTHAYTVPTGMSTQPVHMSVHMSTHMATHVPM